MTTAHTPASDTILSIRDLSVALPASGDRRYAVQDLTLTIRPGEIVCVVGEFGLGKSVTAQSVMGLLPKGQLQPSSGEILLEGENILTASPERLRDLRGSRMAMIFQEPMTALNPVLTVGDQVAEVLQIHTTLDAAACRARVLEMMHAVHLPDPERMIDAYPHQLSGGQRQRIMIAQALILDPALLIADEPTTALDVTTQAQILKLIRDMQVRRGTGVLFITHDFGVVADIADRVVVMQHGRLVESGTRDEIILRPQHPYTKMLIASVPSLTPPARSPVTGPIALETTQLCKTYQSGGGWFDKGRIVRAAHQVNLSLRRGETLGVVGSQVSGKSTVARCIARLIDPSDGGIWIEGENIATLPETRLRKHRKSVQVIFQDPFRSLNPRRTVGQSIIEGPTNFGLSEHAALERARDLMTLVGLSPDALSRYPHQFSGGQRQRISIARALAMQPHILIADEAVSALDVSVQAQVLELLDQIRVTFDLALLFITHDLRVAAQICDRLMVMQKGEVVEEGATVEIFKNPQHPYTKALFDAAPGHDFARQP